MLRNCLALFMNRTKSFQTIYFHYYSLTYTLFLSNTSHCTIMTMLTFVRNSLNSLFELRCLLRIQKQSLACKVFISNSLPSTNFYAYIILNVMRKKLSKYAHFPIPVSRHNYMNNDKLCKLFCLNVSYDLKYFYTTIRQDIKESR